MLSDKRKTDRQHLSIPARRLAIVMGVGVGVGVATMPKTSRIATLRDVLPANCDAAQMRSRYRELNPHIWRCK